MSQMQYSSSELVPELRQILLLGEEMREGDDRELLPRPTTVDEVANVAAIFALLVKANSRG
uniref:Uncharacterized protein n=1 Tax=Rhizophora mucronata TaxID=61149 RepID=A0A2P2JS86_RHIMU